MIKTKIVETTEKYDNDGKLVEKVTREETSEDNTDYSQDTKCYLPSEKELKNFVRENFADLRKNRFWFGF